MTHAVATRVEPALKPLTFRERRFVDALFLTTPVFNGAEAARVAGYSKVGAAVQAVRLLIKANVKAEIEKRQVEIERQSAITHDKWLKRGERYYYADVRKMFDAHGNAIDIPQLGDNEAAMIAGFEIVEDFTKVKKADGSEDAIPTGYTKKFKLVDPLKAHEYYGKIRGFIEEEPDPVDRASKSIHVVFVNSKGARVQVNLANRSALPTPGPLLRPGVKFVK